MPTANEIVRRKKKAELEKSNIELEKKSRSWIENNLVKLEEKLQELIDCDACAKRRAAIRKKIKNVKIFLGMEVSED